MPQAFTESVAPPPRISWLRRWARHGGMFVSWIVTRNNATAKRTGTQRATAAPAGSRPKRLGFRQSRALLDTTSYSASAGESSRSEGSHSATWHMRGRAS